jgi:hypothetical protein
MTRNQKAYLRAAICIALELLGVFIAYASIYAFSQMQIIIGGLLCYSHYPIAQVYLMVLGKKDKEPDK